MLCLVLIANCSAPGSALLGPTFTGVKTGSAYQTSLSYGSSKILDSFKTSINTNISFNRENIKIIRYNHPKKSNVNFEKHRILVANKIYDIIISDVIDEEPLP